MGFDTVGLQYGGECFGGLNPPFKALGVATACTGPLTTGTSPLGGAYANQVFQLMPRGCTPSCKWSYKGCYVDATANRQFPTQIASNLPSAQDCTRLAAEGGYDTIGMQYFGECHVGLSPTYWGLGPATGCTTLGIGSANGVYQLTPEGCSVCSWVFKGCFVDNSSHLVPTLLAASVPSVAACEAYAEVGLYDTYALQAGGQCWGGVNPSYADLGFGVSPNCVTLGGTSTNMVRTRELGANESSARDSECHNRLYRRSIRRHPSAVGRFLSR